MATIHTLFLRQQQESGNTRTPNDSTNQFLNLIQNPFKSAFQVNAFWASLGTSIGFTLFLALLFSLVRTRHTLVYAPKLKYADEKHVPPPVGKGYFSWFEPILKTKEEQIIDKIGLDAVIFLRFTKMCRNLFFVLGVIGCIIMIPVNVAESGKPKGISAFTTMTPMYIGGKALWSHVVCAWAFDIIVAYFLWHNYRAVRRLRMQFFQSPEYQMSLHARTLMVTDIPQSSRTDEGILRLTDEVNPTAVLPRVAIGRNVKELPELIAEHEKTVRQLESVLAKYLKNPKNLPSKRPTCRTPRKHRGDRPESRVDAIEYLTGRIRDLEMEVKAVRDSVDKRNALPYGFASWEMIEEAHAVAYTARNKHPQGTTIQLAPRPKDIIWENLPLSKQARKWKRWMNILWVFLLTLVWIVPNAMIAIFLSDLSNLGLVWPAFQRSLDANSKIWAIVQGVASPALTSLLYLVLPIIFRRLSIRAGDITKTLREQDVLHNLYIFFVFNNLIVFSIFSALWSFGAAVANARKGDGSVWEAIKAGQFYIKIMTALCQVSPFWVTWLLQRNLGAAIDLAQLITLTWIWFLRTFMAPTPRQSIEWTAPPPFDYASYYNFFLFYATVALSFATLQPLVLPVTALYFALDAWLKKYLLLYVFITKTESGGQFWRVLCNRMVFATILANCIIALVVKARGTWLMVIIIAPLPFLMLGFKWYCLKTFDDDCRFYNRAGLKDQEMLTAGKPGKRTDRVLTRFGHPALHKPLITPMVHAKARGVLGRVYQGRLASDGASVAAYSGIAMESMSRNQPGVVNTSDAPFEIVPEAQMDFAFFKNRADFREDYGGDIYGRPEDLISERSQTPRSFMGPGLHSPTSSRASSPSPDHLRQKQWEDNPSAFPGDYDHPAFRVEKQSSAGGDLGMQGGAVYANPNDSESRLLSNAQGVPLIAPGEQMGMDRWRTGGSGYSSVAPQDDPTSYDYFRGRPL